MVIMGVFLALAVLMFGILFFRLHTLPEQLAHKSKKIQFELVAVLGLIALFTHMHIFWIAGLLLAFIDFPDFGTPLGRIAGATEKIAGIEAGGSEPEKQPARSDGHGADPADGPPRRIETTVGTTMKAELHNHQRPELSGRPVPVRAVRSGMACVAATQNKLMPAATARERSLFTHSSFGSLHTFCAPDVLEFSILTFVRGSDARNS